MTKKSRLTTPSFEHYNGKRYVRLTSQSQRGVDRGLGRERCAQPGASDAELYDILLSCLKVAGARTKFAGEPSRP